MNELQLRWPSRYRLGTLTHYQAFGKWYAHMFIAEPILTKWGWNIQHCSWLTKGASADTPQGAIDESIALAEANIAKLLEEENSITPEERARRAGPGLKASAPSKPSAITQDLLDLLDL